MGYKKILSDIFYGIKLEKPRIAHFNSIEDLIKHHDEPCLAFLHSVRFRDPSVTYQQLSGHEFRGKYKRHELILQDRKSPEWMWANDNTISLYKIPEIFSDFEILGCVYGRFNGAATLRCPNGCFEIKGYIGRRTEKEGASQPAPQLALNSISY